MALYYHRSKISYKIRRFFFQVSTTLWDDIFRWGKKRIKCEFPWYLISNFELGQWKFRLAVNLLILEVFIKSQKPFTGD